MVLTLGPEGWLCLGSSGYINLDWPESRKTLNRSVIEGFFFLIPLHLGGLAHVNGKYFTVTWGQGQLPLDAIKGQSNAQLLTPRDAPLTFFILKVHTPRLLEELKIVTNP